jgi:hypothetical protein
MAALARTRSEPWLPDLSERLHLRSPRRREEPATVPVGWIIAGVALVGLGYLTWTYVGPDLRRYLKIHGM